MAGQAAGAVDLHAVAEHQQADTIAAQAVIPVSHGVDHSLARHSQGVLGGLLTGEAADAHAPAHVGYQESLGAADLLAQRAVDILAHELIAHGGAGVAHG
ncbi:hypothetical protein RZS08_58625, partial [Arthrospira platensis SPKY1]|nr:hypothetical protein [Arthrospira platensis SPKY1]